MPKTSSALAAALKTAREALAENRKACDDLRTANRSLRERLVKKQDPKSRR